MLGCAFGRSPHRGGGPGDLSAIAYDQAEPRQHPFSVMRVASGRGRSVGGQQQSVVWVQARTGAQNDRKIRVAVFRLPCCISGCARCIVCQCAVSRGREAGLGAAAGQFVAAGRGPARAPRRVAPRVRDGGLSGCRLLPNMLATSSRLYCA